MPLWDRPLPPRIAALAILASTALMLLGGALREQTDLTRSGLMLLAMGAVLLPGAFRKNQQMKIVFFVLASVGVFYAVTT